VADDDEVLDNSYHYRYVSGLNVTGERKSIQ
jgi:hypothetical protein